MNIFITDDAALLDLSKLNIYLIKVLIFVLMRLMIYQLVKLR